MNEHRFRLLELEMLRAGVALRHARRAALELESHHRDLAQQALARGASPEEAQQSAHEALGADALLLERYLRQTELQSWAHRWRVGYVLAPLLGFAALFVAAIMVLIGVSSGLSPVLHHMRLPAALTHDLDVVVSVSLLWVIPAVVAMAFGVLAGRQHVAPGRFVAGIVVLSMVVAQMNVQFVLGGGATPGAVSAGIGVSDANIPHEFAHVLAVTAMTLIPAGWLRHWLLSRRTALE